MGEVKLLVRKYLAELVFRDFLKWVKADTIIICQPSIKELVALYLKERYE